LVVTDIERLPRIYGEAQRPFIRIGEGHDAPRARRREAIARSRLVAGITGAYAKRGGGAL